MFNNGVHYLVDLKDYLIVNLLDLKDLNKLEEEVADYKNEN